MLFRSKVNHIIGSHIGMKAHLLSLLCVCLLLLSSCGTTEVTVVGSFPKPLVNQQALRLGVYYSPEFLNYHYLEKATDRHELDIEMGTSQKVLFDAVLQAMFNEVITLDSLEAIAATEDLVIVSPHLMELQYSVPRENNSKVFEVWLKYQVSFLDRQGKVLRTWKLSAYGKSPSAQVGSDEEGFQQAIIVALRDLGVSLTLQLPKQPEIRSALAGLQGGDHA